MAPKGERAAPGRRVSVRDVCRALATVAPPGLAAEWDNVGLLIGDPGAVVHRLLLTTDLTLVVLKEALGARAEMVMAYHPVIFRPVARLTAREAPVAYRAARANLAVYSMHTALDAVEGGTNDALAERIGIVDARPLQPAAGRSCKIVVFVPPAALPAVAEAAFAAGAGRIGQYAECSFRAPGVGTFRGEEGTHPRVGRRGRREEVKELRLEVVAPRGELAAVASAIRKVHPYETPAIDAYALEGLPGPAGLGRIGRLEEPVPLRELLDRIKRRLGVRRVLVAGGRAGKISKVACCAGSCGDLFRAALAEGAHAYVTGEMRHHDALAAAAAGVTVICVGHSNSERPVLRPLAGKIRQLLPGLDVLISRQDRDPFEVI